MHPVNTTIREVSLINSLSQENNTNNCSQSWIRAHTRKEPKISFTTHLIWALYTLLKPHDLLLRVYYSKGVLKFLH